MKNPGQGSGGGRRTNPRAPWRLSRRQRLLLDYGQGAAPNGPAFEATPKASFMIGGPFDQRGQEPSNLIRLKANAPECLWITWRARGTGERSCSALTHRTNTAARVIAARKPEFESTGSCQSRARKRSMVPLILGAVASGFAERD